MDISSLKRNIRKMILAAIAVSSLCMVAQRAEADEKWSVTVFGATQLRGDIWATFYLPDFNANYQFAALAVSRTILSFKKYIDLELEGQAIKHLGDQHHEEFNGLLVARWLRFPWNKHLDTTFAVGNGFSYATETPRLEEIMHDKTSRFLNCMMFELTFSLPDRGRWSLVWRVHHRSGIYGLFGGVEGAANAMGLGLKYRF